MPSPFPGMDPYLEAPEIWPDVHQRIAFVLSETLGIALRPRYVALVHHDIEVERIMGPDDPEAGSPGRRRAAVSVVASGREAHPHAGGVLAPAPVVMPLPEAREVKHFRIEVQEAAKKRLVAVIEILSRANKLPGRDRTAYEEKRAAYLESPVHFIEIDLLRCGHRWHLGPRERHESYRLLVSRARGRRNAEIWPVRLQDPLPVIPLPLLPPDPDIPMDLGTALQRVYEGANYDLLIDYGAPPPPPTCQTTNPPLQSTAPTPSRAGFQPPKGSGGLQPPDDS